MAEDIYIQLVEMRKSTLNSAAEWISAFRFKQVVRALQLCFRILLLS